MWLSFPSRWRKVWDFSWFPLSWVQCLCLSLSLSLCLRLSLFVGVSQEPDLGAPGLRGETSKVSLVPVSLSWAGAWFLAK